MMIMTNFDAMTGAGKRHEKNLDIKWTQEKVAKRDITQPKIDNSIHNFIMKCIFKTREGDLLENSSGA